MIALYGKVAFVAKRGVLLAVACFLTSSIYATDRDPIPPGSQLVAYLRPHRILTEPLLSETVPRLVTEFTNELKNIGISSDDLNNSVVFVSSTQSDWLNMSPKSGDIQFEGGWLSADFQKSDTLLAIAFNDGWFQKTFESSGLFWFANEYSYYVDNKSGMAIADIDGYGLAITSSENIMVRVLEVASGSKPSISSDDFYLQMRGQYESNPNIYAYLCLTPPPEALDVGRAVDIMGQAVIEYIGVGGIGTLMEASGQVERVSALVGISGNDYWIEIHIGMDCEKSASFMSGILQMGTGLLSMIPKDKLDANAIQDFRVSRQSSTVKVRLGVTKEQLKSLIHG